VCVCVCVCVCVRVCVRACVYASVLLSLVRMFVYVLPSLLLMHVCWLVVAWCCRARTHATSLVR
jgi:hypothetical protein